MADIMQGISINAPQVQKIDTSKLDLIHVSEMRDNDLFEDYIKSQEKFLESKHSIISDTSGNPRYAEYASIAIGNTIVAQIDNHGFTSSDNAYGRKINAAIREADQAYGRNESGPELAKLRAEKIAEALGGSVKIASTALTQAEFNAAPAAKVHIDYNALRDDPMYEILQQTKRARSLYIAQEIGQNGAVNTATADSDKNVLDQTQSALHAENDDKPLEQQKTTTEEFLEYMDMTPEERYLVALLAKYDLTKEEFDALPLEEQEKIMAEVKQDVIENVEEKTGIEAGALVGAMQA